MIPNRLPHVLAIAEPLGEVKKWINLLNFCHIPLIGFYVPTSPGSQGMKDQSLNASWREQVILDEHRICTRHVQVHDIP